MDTEYNLKVALARAEDYYSKLLLYKANLERQINGYTTALQMHFLVDDYRAVDAQLKETRQRITDLRIRVELARQRNEAEPSSDYDDGLDWDDFNPDTDYF